MTYQPRVNCDPLLQNVMAILVFADLKVPQKFSSASLGKQENQQHAPTLSRNLLLDSLGSISILLASILLNGSPGVRCQQKLSVNFNAKSVQFTHNGVTDYNAENKLAKTKFNE